jgi:hypothetical protein
MRVALTMLALGMMLAPAVRATPPSTPSIYLRLFDANHDGRVSLVEYQAHMMRGFRAMDRNHDGVIERDEQPPGPRRHGAITLRQYRHNLAVVFHRQDIDHDGYLDARELAAPPR